jgi:hypothetical protein
VSYTRSFVCAYHAAQQWRAGDAAGAASIWVRLWNVWRADTRLVLPTLPAAHLTPSVGRPPIAATAQGCAITRLVVRAIQRCDVNINPKRSAGQIRMTYGGRQSERPSPGTAPIRVAACGFGSIGHGHDQGRHVRFHPSPDSSA